MTRTFLFLEVAMQFISEKCAENFIKAIKHQPYNKTMLKAATRALLETIGRYGIKWPDANNDYDYPVCLKHWRMNQAWSVWLLESHIAACKAADLVFDEKISKAMLDY